MSELKYKVGDKVLIKDIDWYNRNKNNHGDVLFAYKLFSHGVYTWEHAIFTKNMAKYCGQTLTISEYSNMGYKMQECIDSGEDFHIWTDEMFEGLVDEEMKSEDGLLDEYEELTDRAFKGGYEKCKSDIELNGFQLPDGYIFKDENGNEIHALKIVLEKANTLKIQSDNMETETHRGYYTTEEETANKSKKVAWFTFWDNDFADKVELDLSNRELTQEDGKWFVVKKKNKYPKTYEECCDKINFKAGFKEMLLSDDEYSLYVSFIKLKRCRDAYWKIAGDEMGLGKPWKPDYDSGVNKYGIICMNGVVQKSNPTTNWERHLNKVLDFPTPEMRDAFYESFKKEIEFCKELL